MDYDIFDNSERIILNGNAQGINVSELSKKRILENLNIAKSVSTEPELLDTINGLIAKVNRITDDEWSALCLKLPFPVAVDAETNVDEVPSDEEVERAV